MEISNKDYELIKETALAIKKAIFQKSKSEIIRQFAYMIEYPITIIEKIVDELINYECHVKFGESEKNKYDSPEFYYFCDGLLMRPFKEQKQILMQFERMFAYDSLEFLWIILIDFLGELIIGYPQYFILKEKFVIQIYYENEF